MKAKKKAANQLEARVAQLEESWKRALADYANLEKRFEKQKQALSFFIKGEIVLDFLKLFDDLKRSQAVLKNDGLQLILEDFKIALQKQGVKEIEVVGKSFDPERMEAVEKTKGAKKGQVSRLVEAGYLIDDQVLRPAKVAVAG